MSTSLSLRRTIQGGICAAIVALSTLTGHAGQNRDSNQGNDGRSPAKVPKLGPDALVPSCYNSASGAWRVARGNSDCSANEFFIQVNSRGPQGVPGATGPTGATGATGPQGLVGPAGPTGLTGATGSQGAAGNKGDAGPQGVAGEKGTTGPQGVAGDKGETGAQGLAGPTGATGLTGATGAAGSQGSTGDKGDVGPQGPSGATGPAGPGFTFRGSWDIDTGYLPNDVVTEGGSSFIAVAANLAADPIVSAQTAGGA